MRLPSVVFRRKGVKASTRLKRPPRTAVMRLFEPQAVDVLAEALFQFPDPDEVLQKAGLSRADLRVLEGDDEISAALETRLSALLSTPWRLEPGKGPVTEFVLEEITPWMERVIAGLWEAVPYGYAVLEVTYRRDGNRIRWASVDERPFEWFRPTPDGQLRFFPRDGSGGVEGVEVDTRWKFFLCRRRPSSRNPYGKALLSRLYWPWFFRTNGWKFWARFLERHGAPLLVGKTPGDVKGMAEALARSVQSAVAVVGAEDEVTAISPANAGDAFDRFCREVNKRIQKVILGQTLTSDVDRGGSYAAAKVHAEVRDDRRKADIRMVVPAVQRMINALVELNFPAATPPAFVMEDEKGLELERAKRDATLAKAGIAQFTEQYLLDRYDYRPGDVVVPALGPMFQQSARASATPPLPGPLMGPLPWARQFVSKRRRFTKDQQEVEDLADDAIRRAGQPVDPALIRKAVLAARTPEDLAERLAVLLRDHDPTVFQTALEQALFAADVLGYIHADER